MPHRHQSASLPQLIMRTSVLVAFLALLAVSLAAFVEEKSSADSKYDSATAESAESDESVKVINGDSAYEKSTSDKSDAASTRSGAASKKDYKYVDNSGNCVSATSSNNVVSASDSTSSSSTSVEKAVIA